MTATIYLHETVSEQPSPLPCEEVRVLGDVVWAMPSSGDREWVIPLRNVTAIAGEEVEQFVDEIPSTGGQYTELVTDVR